MSAREDFWSRRKAAVAAENEAELDAVQREEAARTQEELAEKSDAEILADLDLPDPDTLEAGDDFSVFLKQAVPERLRRRALRRLWLSNPLLANLDELVEYGEDYTDAATVVENLSTTYQVGKGMMKHLLAMEEAEKEAATDQPEEVLAEDAAPQEHDLEDPSEEIASATPEAAETPDHASDPAQDAEHAAAPARRRMRFDFAT